MTAVAQAPASAGFSSAEAARLLKEYGANELVAKKKSPIEKLVRWFLSPIPLMLMAASALSYATGKISDGSLILFLLAANYGIQFWHEHKADRAVAKLEEHLAASALVRRDGAWKNIAARLVVPGDLLMLKVGARVPADAKLISATNLSLNESMLTGESLPRERRAGEEVYSASFVLSGTAVALATKTGNRTYFGAAVKTLDLARKRSVLEEDILSISKLLTGLALLAIVVLTVVLLAHGAALAELGTLDLSLLIAGIPVALPTVMSLIITAGVLEVAKGGAVVRRLSALEDLANVNLLLSDKTGTLTENKIRVASVTPLGAWSESEALAYAASATDESATNPLEGAIREAAHARGLALLPQTSFIPGDSDRKRSTAVVEARGARMTIALGAPKTVAELSRFTAAAAGSFDAAVKAAAARGDRALLVAINRAGGEERGMEPVAVIALADTLRADARATVAAMRAQGIGVKMLTGDGLPIAREVARTLDLAGEVYPREVFDDPRALSRALPAAAGFAEVLPRDKYAAVEAAKHSYRVAVTGDGANDIPSVSDADVGIAVASSVDALRETADIVLLSDGLSVIATAIREARIVFMRLYHYSLYRISESARLILTIAIIGVAIGEFPLTPIQIILLAFLNDVPIVSLALDRVRIPHAPASIDAKERAVVSFSFGFAGILNSILMLWLAYGYLHLPWPWIQTLFFLKLVVSGHMLVYVAHTESTWFRWFPSWQVIAAVSTTQLLATLAALAGFFTAAIPPWLVLFVWVWSFFWMQVTALFKKLADLPFRARAPVLAAP